MTDSQSVGMCLSIFPFPSGFHSWMKLCEFMLRIVFGNSQKMLNSNFISAFIGNWKLITEGCCLVNELLNCPFDG